MASSAEDTSKANGTKANGAVHARKAAPKVTKDSAKASTGKASTGKTGAGQPGIAKAGAAKPETSATKAGTASASGNVAGRRPAARAVNYGRRASSGNGSIGAGKVIGVAAAGLAAGLVANLGRKAAVQAPSVMAGDWLEALKAEHKMALALLGQMEKTTSKQVAKRTLLLTQLKHALGKHAFTEENIIYPALREWGDKADADALNHEQGYHKQFLYELDGMDKASSDFTAKVVDFRTDLEAHIREEEDKIFPKLHGALTAEKNKALTARQPRRLQDGVRTVGRTGLTFRTDMVIGSASFEPRGQGREGWNAGCGQADSNARTTSGTAGAKTSGSKPKLANIVTTGRQHPAPPHGGSATAPNKSLDAAQVTTRTCLPQAVQHRVQHWLGRAGRFFLLSRVWSRGASGEDRRAYSLVRPFKIRRLIHSPAQVIHSPVQPIPLPRGLSPPVRAELVEASFCSSNGNRKDRASTSSA